MPGRRSRRSPCSSVPRSAWRAVAAPVQRSLCAGPARLRARSAHHLDDQVTDREAAAGRRLPHSA
ncbi:hypothetical protein NGM37_60305, partial [Streptomyces sp. TRM76130]|nr:hypothetical protein [Streptomyces sp. TRM76130]